MRFDSQAGFDESTDFIIQRVISGEIIIVSEYDPISAAGIERLKARFPEELTYDRTWILLNKMLPDFVKSFSDFLEVAKYLSPIPWDSDVVRAYARRRLALDLKTGNQYTLAIIRALKSLLAESISSEIDSWEQERAESIREPLKVQYNDVIVELGAIDEQKENVKRRVLRRTRLFMILQIMSFGMIGGLFYSVIKDIELPMFYVIITAVTIITILILYMFSQQKLGYPESQSSGLEEREERLTNILKKLDALRNADLESLIKSDRLTRK